MSKFKVGDVVKPSSKATDYIHPRLIRGEEYLVLHGEDGVICVSGEFAKDDSGEGWSEDWFELAVVSVSAESLRQAILDIRSKREPLQKEVLQLEEQEKELVAQLKGKGFALID